MCTCFHICYLCYVLLVVTLTLKHERVTPTSTMEPPHLMPTLTRATVTTWDFIDRTQLTAWSIDPASGIAHYHGRVRISTSHGTLRIHQCIVWQTPPFPVPLAVLFGAFWTAPVVPQPEAQGVPGEEGSAVGEASTGGSDTSTLGSWMDGALPAFLGEPEGVYQGAAAAAGDGSIGGPKVPHLVSHSLSSEEGSCVEIPPPSSTPTMSLILISSDTGGS
jgi:hypothetical protein